MISSLLGELENLTGKVNINGTITYVPQQAWMQNATVKDNILFGKVYNQDKYASVIDACALQADLDILSGGDKTEIGEKGINLSGGQKQRISLARAVYNNAEVYLMDDPLSAVDSQVGKHIFEKVISHNGLLKSKTRLLVTHGLNYLPRCDHIIILKNGKVSEQGSYQELVDKEGEFASYLLEYMTGGSTGNFEGDRKDLEEEPQSKCTKSGKKEEKEATALIENEGVETGSVGWNVYFHYMKALGFWGVFVSLLFQTIYQASNIGTSFWLNVWSGDAFDLLNGLNTTDGRTKYLGVYLGIDGTLGFLQSIGVVVLNIALSLTTLRASEFLHRKMLHRVFQSPMEFFDTTPLGRIVNRFGKDVDVCDNVLYNAIKLLLNTLTNFAGTIVMICFLIPELSAVILPMGLLFYSIQRVYISTARQLKRLESVTRSPIYSHFGETLNGASTIRAFGLQNKFVLESEARVDANQKCYFPSYISTQWLSVVLGIIGNFFTFAASVFAVTSDGISKYYINIQEFIVP